MEDFPEILDHPRGEVLSIAAVSSGYVTMLAPTLCKPDAKMTESIEATMRSSKAWYCLSEIGLPLYGELSLAYFQQEGMSLEVGAEDWG